MEGGRIKLWRTKPRTLPEDELSRRQFMQLVSAAAATALVNGCQPDPPEQILPYVRRPPHVTPGKSTYYATSLVLDGLATGLLVATREGRPIKVEGNPAHPASLGGTGVFQQASVLQLYDPDRGKAVLHRGLPADWNVLDRVLAEPRTDSGAGLRLVLEPSSSPLMLGQLAAIKRRYPACKLTFYAPTPSFVPASYGAKLFGKAVVPQYQLAAADVLVTFDADLLSHPSVLRYTRDFAARRHVEQPSASMNRLYAFESALSPTGSMADHRLARPAARIALLATALAARFGAAGALSESAARTFEQRLDAQEQRFIGALARDLQARPRGRTLIVPGERQPFEVHALCHALNAQLGNVGQTLVFTATPRLDDAADQDLAALANELHAGAVDTLLVLGPNPSYDAPAELDWSRGMRKVKHSLCAGLYVHETAEDAAWFAPLLHPFETWGDARAFDGTLSFVQPLIRPLYAGRSVSEILGILANEPASVGDYARLRVGFGRARGEELTLQMSAAERRAREAPDVRRQFEGALARGFSPDSAFAAIDVSVDREVVTRAQRSVLERPEEASLELNLLRSPTLHDGRFANVSWLLELPEPITKLTWDNAALMSPNTARKFGIPVQPIGDDDHYPVVELTRAGRTIRAPVLSLPSHADDSVSLWLGYGREGAERLARGVGVNAYRLRSWDAQEFAPGLQLEPLSERYPLAITQLHTDMHERPIALTKTLSAYRAEPDFTARFKGDQPSFLEPVEMPGPQWAMTIDMSMCSGCSACMLACQAENNLLVVGKEQVRRGRVMHWLRIDLYAEQGGAGKVVHQPMLCQHCEKAPCEYVCPVNATVHSPDGLNEMVYNRCVGTRFCSNNCPYKVRRFNWFDWSQHQPSNQGSVMLQRNPEVSVRERGVMEKCTYCVQRIRAAEIDARTEHRELRAGEVVTACQQACPARAISFDSLTLANTQQARWREQPRSYAVLHETGARPRTTYLARIDNPNPELA